MKRHEEEMGRLAESERESEKRNAAWEKRHEEAVRRREESERESKRRHEEAMTSLRALIERTGGPGPSVHA